MATARLEELKARFDDNPRRYFAPYANELRKSGDLAQAIAICRTHLATQPGHVSGHIVLAQALHEAGEIDDARGTFEVALTIDPENLIALRYMGDIARERGDVDDARVWYGRVLDADPRNDEIASLLRDLASAPNGSSPKTMQPPVIGLPQAAAPPSDFAPPDHRELLPMAAGAAPHAPAPTPAADVPVMATSETVDLPLSGFTTAPDGESSPEMPGASAGEPLPTTEAVTPPHVRAVANESPQAAAPNDDDLLYWNGDIDQSLADATRDLTSTWQPQSTPAAHFSDFEAAPEPWVNEAIEESFDSALLEFPSAAAGAAPSDIESWFDEPAPVSEPDLPGGPAHGMSESASPEAAHVESAAAAAGEPAASAAEEAAPPAADAAPDAAAEPAATTEATFADADGFLTSGEALPPTPAAESSMPVTPTPVAPQANDYSWWMAPEGVRAAEPEPEPSQSAPPQTIPAALAVASEVGAADSPRTELPAPNVRAAELPAAELPAAELSAAEFPAPDVRAAELPAPELPASELPASELPPAELPATTDTQAVEAPVAANTSDEQTGIVPEVPDRPTRPSLTSVAAIPESRAMSPAPFVTETLAELYVQQGFREEALAIYRELVQREPANDTLRERMDALQRGDMPAAPAAADIRNPAGVSVRTFFSRLAQRKPSTQTVGQMGRAGAPPDAGAAFATEASPEHTALAQLFAAARPSERDASAASTLASAFSEPAGFSTPGGRPTRMAERELSLDHLFRDQQRSGGASGSMDEFYSSAGGTTPSASPGAGASDREDGGDDLHQFTAWLEGLKKK